MTVDGPEAIAEAVGRLRAGGLVAFPTETVYGLGADALNTDAVMRVFAAKGRPSENPLIVHVSGVEMARRVVREFNPAAERLARALWPGPVTIVVEKAACVPDAVTAGGPTVAVRCPDHPLALALIEAFGGPLVGPSANPSGYISPTTAGHVARHFEPGEVLVLDGGACRAGLESTVVDLTADVARVLRRGVVGADELAEALGERVEDAGSIVEPDGGGTIATSPGLVGPHYRPRARVVVVGSMTEIDGALEGVRSAVVLSPPGTPATVPPQHASLPMPGGARAYAAELYAALREADELSPGVIVVALPGIASAVGGADAGDAAVWAAVRERLARASA
ncbi:MAG: L-threonylcarbamoyladenylate synthase [Planctomycetota bacterium]